MAQSMMRRSGARRTRSLRRGAGGVDGCVCVADGGGVSGGAFAGAVSNAGSVGCGGGRSGNGIGGPRSVRGVDEAAGVAGVIGSGEFG